MNKSIRTRAGLITGIVVIAYVLLLRFLGIPDQSPLVLAQFGIVFVGLLASTYLLFKHYAGIRFIEAFTHCTRTLATALVVILFGYTLMFWLIPSAESSMAAFNFMLMKLLFAFAFSGLLSSAFASYIFYTFTRNKIS